MKSKIIMLTILLSLIGSMTYANTSKPTDLITRFELESMINKLNSNIDAQAKEINDLKAEKFAVSDEQRLMNAVEKNKKSVVTVLSSNKEGAGFFVSEHLIVTVEHVLDSTDEVYIIPFNGLEVKGKIIKRDFGSDLALIQIDGSGVPVSMNKEITVGETAIAIGHPLRYENTVTKGIVSFINRSVTHGFATQIDTAINSGSSGGPLLNLNGDVIGLVRSRIYTYNQGSTDDKVVDGIGFATRVEDIQDFIK